LALGLLAAKKAEHVVAVEIQKRLQVLCEVNAKQNGLCENFELVSGDMRRNKLFDGKIFDLIVANPPFWAADEGHLPEDDERRAACHEVLIDLDGWVGVAARLLEPRKGRLCAVFPVRRIAELLACLRRHDLGVTALLFVHPRVEEQAELVLVEARRGVKRPVSIWSPLFLRDDANAETEVARMIFSGAFSEELAAREDRRPPMA